MIIIMIIIFIIRGYSTTTTHFGRSIPHRSYMFSIRRFLFFEKRLISANLLKFRRGSQGG